MVRANPTRCERCRVVYDENVTETCPQCEQADDEKLPGRLRRLVERRGHALTPEEIDDVLEAADRLDAAEAFCDMFTFDDDEVSVSVESLRPELEEAWREWKAQCEPGGGE